MILQFIYTQPTFISLLAISIITNTAVVSNMIQYDTHDKRHQQIQTTRKKTQTETECNLRLKQHRISTNTQYKTIESTTAEGGAKNEDHD